ncbi:FKBP-type peptidyl-prolyl cis-trans isomerase domain-containing protein [Phthorimaea operculella]|nr:FKBP-type peptidyl-prolyl cis-trans isomerase domain-containing protein [Phthorimaea operculella]
MFWGLIMEPNKRYTQVVEKPFHISQAAMDISTGDNEPCQVMVVVDGKNFLVCTLQKKQMIQVPLDLYFKAGDSVSFLTNGKCNVHLTGYLDPEFEEEPSDDEEEEEDEDEAPELVQPKNKRKLENSNDTNAKKAKKDKKQAAEDSSDDEDDEDQLKKLLDGDMDSDENDESFKMNTSAEADSTDLSKLSKSARRRLKAKLKKEGKEPLTNGTATKKEKQEAQKPEKKNKEAKKEVKEEAGDKKEKKSLSGGVFIEDLKVGSGPAAKPGKTVMVYYEGRLKQNNKMFDNCVKGPGFKFRLGAKEVISGWDVGVAGMKVGGKRKIVCPPNMAYGAKGSPPVIPPNSTLVFEVELKNVK